MPWELIDSDLASGRHTYAFIEGDQVKAIRVDMPTTALEQIKYENGEAEKATHGVRFGEWNRVASVPLPLLTESGLDTAVQMRDDKFVSKWLNDPDHQAFRTSRGKV